MAIDITALWDFGKPDVSEQRFRDALASASKDDQFILRTQIARTFGLRRDFDRAREELAAIEADLPTASPEGAVRYWLELGRSHCSATHPATIQTIEVKETGRACYLRAFELAQQAQLDYLAIDALHMMTMVDVDGADQVRWNEKAIAYMDASKQEDARKWEGSLRNNLGYANHLLGRYDDALSQFKLALALREAAGKPEPIRVAYWMIAWTLRAMGNLDEALTIQVRLEQECEAAGSPDPYVFEELAHLYRAKGDEPLANSYEEKAKALNS